MLVTEAHTYYLVGEVAEGRFAGGRYDDADDARDDAEAVDAIKVAQSWTAVAGFGVATGIAAGALAVVFWSRARQSRRGNQAMVRRRLQLHRSPTRAPQAAACGVELVVGG